ncbi:MAG: isoprenoid biosynthesis glyoxalase ElbB [Crocinitomicaceae bacterium]|nr:isoprenoid biosynthesis glyoxalase ElbB [Crocinitomicaceae bacterium]
MKIGVLLSGCGVFDGAEIQEAVLAMLAIKEEGAEYICISIDRDQHHVIDHSKGEEMPEKRNMLVEAARIARGDIKNINDITPAEIDGLVIPGGFGSAKNFTKWAFEGPQGDILPEVKLLLVNMVNVGKPIAALCVSPVVVAKAFEGSEVHPKMTIGTAADKSEYDINGFAQGLEATGAISEMKNIHEIAYDEQNKIITAPCYMMDTDILGIRENSQLAIKKLVEVCKSL